MSPGVRAAELLRSRPLWAIPIVIGSILIALMTVLYIGSVVDPVSHMEDLPVSIVNEDAGAEGGKVEEALRASPEVTSKLAIEASTLEAARERMDRDDAYATVVIPQDFSASLASLREGPPPGGQPTLPTVTILTNVRAGTTASS